MVEAVSSVHTEKRRTIVYLDATDGDITFTVGPASSVETDVTTEFFRIDDSANAVTITDGGSLTMTLVGASDNAALVSDGTDYYQRASASATGEVTLNGVQTLTNKTLTSPKIGTSILSASGAKIKEFETEPGTPVNNLTEGNSATGDPVIRGAAGSDSNITIQYKAKGSGGHSFGGVMTQGNDAATYYKPSSAASATSIVKKVTSIPNDTFTDILTITVPNAVHSAGVVLKAVGALGDGDSTACDEYFIAIARQTDESTIAEGDINVTAIAQPSATGAETIAMVFQISGITGAAGATQTFTVQAKITRGGGASDNHYLTFRAEIINQNASGVTAS